MPNIEETEDEKNIPDITPEQEAEWDGPQPKTCEGYWHDCQCTECLEREELEDGGDRWLSDDDDDDEDEDQNEFLG